MKADAQERLDVYQAGRSAFFSDRSNPYHITDWRCATWQKGFAAAGVHHEAPAPETVSCGICGTQTRMTGTERCDRCFELESRIRRDPVIARLILDLL